MSKKRDAEALARGKWKGVLTSIGIAPILLNGKHHPCPGGANTGTTKKSFRFSDKFGNGGFFCQCSEGNKDGFDLLRCCKGMDFASVAEKIREISGGLTDDEKIEVDRNRVRSNLRYVQNCITEDRSVVEAYLRGRGIERVPATLKQGVVSYGLGAVNRPETTAMLARVVACDGQPLTWHITYIENGRKATHERARVMMTPLRDLSGTGAAVRLEPMTEDGTLGIGEGIETSLSAGARFGVPAWAALNTALLAQFEPPAGCKRLVIFADNDPKFGGQAAAYAAAKRLKHRKVAIDVVEVMVPPTPGDWNDEEHRNAV